MDERIIQRGHRALRRGRTSEAHGIYLVTTTTQNRIRLFSTWPTACVASRAVNAVGTFLDAQCLCWVLMPDHWHGLIQLGETNSLPIVVRRFKATVAFAVNRSLGRRGPIWSSAFHDRGIRKEEDLREVARYIIANPLRAGLVDRVGLYPFWNAVWL